MMYGKNKEFCNWYKNWINSNHFNKQGVGIVAMESLTDC
jgi:hypothetical protein